MGRRIIIIGGGIIGLCSAYYLEKEGHDIIIIDKSDMNSGASYVNAGYLTPSHIIPMASPGMISKGLRYMFDSSSPFYMKPRLDKDFIKWAWYFKKSSTTEKVEEAIPLIRDLNVLSRELFMDIKASGDLGSFHLERKGLLMYYQTQAEGDHEMQIAEKARFLGLEVKQLNPSGIRKIEPNISVNAIGAIHYECDGHTTPEEFMKKMKNYLERRGVRICTNEEVVNLTTSNGKIATVETTKNVYKTDDLVFAAGSWSSNLAKQLEISLPIQAGKGYRIDVKEPTGITMPAILMEAKMAVTPMKGFTRFAGTMEFSGINSKIRKKRVAAIANNASNYFKGLQISQNDRAEAKCGLRPVTPDGLPYIGKASGYKNLVIATGHAMMGWSLGPITGSLVAQLISNSKTTLDIKALHPERKFK